MRCLQRLRRWERKDQRMAKYQRGTKELPRTDPERTKERPRKDQERTKEGPRRKEWGDPIKYLQRPRK